MSSKNLLFILIVTALAAAGLLWLSYSRSDQSASSHPVIERYRQAFDAPALNTATNHFVIEGAATNAGSNGTYRLIFNGDGRFIQKLDAEIGQVIGFDGRKGWRVDWSDMPAQLELQGLAWERLIANIQTGQWLIPQSPYVPTLRSETDGELLFDMGHLHLDDFHADLYFDAVSGDPIRLVQLTGRGKETISLEEYQTIEGLRLPTLVTISTSGIERIRYELHDVSSTNNADYAMPTARPNDTLFDASVDAALTLKRAATGHLLIEPRVNGEALGWFVFDSGAAVSAISKEAAAQLGLSQLGSLPLVSILGVQNSPIYRLDSIELGPLTVSGSLALEMDLAPFSAAFGVQINGIFGYDLLARSVIEVELASDTMWIYEPENYRLSGGKWTELILDSQHPVVKASMAQGDDLLFRLDLGSQLGLTIHTPWVDRLKLLEGKEFTPTPLTPNISGAILEIPWFELAGQRFENLPTIHILDDVPPLNDRATTGNIGLQLLNGLRVVFDYSHKRIALLSL